MLFLFSVLSRRWRAAGGGFLARDAFEHVATPFGKYAYAHMRAVASLRIRSVSLFPHGPSHACMSCLVCMLASLSMCMYRK